MRHQSFTQIHHQSISRRSSASCFKHAAYFSHNVNPRNSLHSSTEQKMPKKSSSWDKKKKGQNPKAQRLKKSQTNLIRYQSRYTCNVVCSVIVSTHIHLRDRAGRLAETLAVVKLLSITVTLRCCRAPGCFAAQVPHQQITHNTPRGFPRLTESFLLWFVLFVRPSVNSGTLKRNHWCFLTGEHPGLEFRINWEHWRTQEPASKYFKTCGVY